MNPRRTKGLVQISVGVLLLLIAVGLSVFGGRKNESVVSNFADCAAAGYPVMESYPRQCKTPNGETFKEDIGNELDKDDLIRIAEPRPNVTISSPLTVKGMARGNWFFEASFPITLLDREGNILAQVPAQAKGDWMTTEFVPFEAILTFTAPIAGSGTLILQKDNPSGLPEHDDELRVPVVFKADISTSTPPVAKACIVTGCSSQLCAEEKVISTCEYREEYACYKTAACERQASGKCGWTETAALRTCLSKAE